ncbi:MAG: hypothetical protein DYG92_04570 [Leptolyngbya sp. PLA1]|nr:hypothetical protein [Leptolyngbya sp. PLA1]
MKDRAYVILVSWPTDREEEGCVRAVRAAVGCDEYTARLIARRRVPCIAARAESGSEAQRVVGRLLGEGVGALSLTWEQIASGLEPPLLRSLAWAEGAPAPMYLASRVDGGVEGLKAADLRLLVRGKVRISKREAMPNANIGEFARTPVDPILGVPVPADPTRAKVLLKTVEVLDLHLLDGTQLRCDGSRFSFLSTGGSLGISDTENMDRLAMKLAGEAPRAVVDTGFGEARFLSEYMADFMSVRGSLQGGDPRGMVALSIYSRMMAGVRAWMG